jgi:hypothetical protein
VPRGSKEKYTNKQKRKAEHIEESYEDRGVGEEEAKRRAWATLNKHESHRLFCSLCPASKRRQVRYIPLLAL